MPKVSVVIPVYNVEKYLRQCLDSVLNQTLKDIEIICVNDGSTDDCGKILDEYAAKDSRIKVIHQENKGTHLARKMGVAATTGDYLMFLDSDDEFTPDACEKAQSAARKENSDIVQFGMNIRFLTDITENQRKDQQTSFTPFEGTFYGRKQIFQALYPGADQIYEPNIFTRIVLSMRIFNGIHCRKVFSEINDERILVGEDGYACILNMYYANRITSISDKLYIYNYGAGISVSNNTIKRCRSCCDDARKIHGAQLAFADSHAEDADLIRQAADTYYFFLLRPFLCYLSDIHQPEDVRQKITEIFQEMLPVLPLQWTVGILSQFQQTSLERLNAVYLEKEILQERYDELLKSTSWQITAPLRKLMSL